MIFADIEANGLRPTKIHCLWADTGEGIVGVFNKEQFHETFPDPNKQVWCFHNGLNYDVHWLNKLWDAGIDPERVVDTFVTSRTLNYKRFITHSLKEIGEFLGVHKGEYDGGWDEHTAEMDSYCIQDVVVTKAIWEFLSKDKGFASCKNALRTEHRTAWLCRTMTENGFLFDKDKAEELLESIQREMDELELSFRTEIPARVVETKRVKNRVKADGTEYSTVTKAKASCDWWEVEGDEIVCYNYEHFSPASPQQRIDVLWDYGWQPTEMTKGHYKFLQEKKRRYYK